MSKSLNSRLSPPPNKRTAAAPGANGSTAPILVLAITLWSIAASISADAAAADCLDLGPFDAKPERVSLEGYDGDAMEPFLSRDGAILLFNNRNHKSVDTNLHWAERIDALSFAYRGEIDGLNSGELDAVASMDAQGTLYFVSTRSYFDTLSTLYRADFLDGRVSAPKLVPGVSRHELGILNFDAEISADGKTLYTVDGRFDGKPWPQSADLVLARRAGKDFERRQDDQALIGALNTDALEYAAAISADGCEIFFTRMEPAPFGPRFSTWRSFRTRPEDPFPPPERVAAMKGYAEAPTLSPDGRSIYYHAKRKGRFIVERLRR